jgi:hypothetical protein
MTSETLRIDGCHACSMWGDCPALQQVPSCSATSPYQVLIMFPRQFLQTPLVHLMHPIPGAQSQGAEDPEGGSGCKLGVVLATRGWATAFDDDDELVYDPATTAALILSRLSPDKACSGE